MAVPRFSTRCLHKRQIAPGVYELRLQKPEGFTFKAGQFVLFDVPLEGNANDIQARAYSIASAPFEQDLLFVIKLVPGGRASRWVEQDVQEGTIIHMKGPFGAFTLHDDGTDSSVFIATGTGIAPLRSHLLWALKERHDAWPLHLLFGARRKEDLFWNETWKELERDHANFHAHVSFLDGEADWHGESGTIQERLSPLLSPLPKTSVYLCGAPDMVKSIKQLCMTHHAIPAKQIHTEQYV